MCVASNHTSDRLAIVIANRPPPPVPTHHHSIFIFILSQSKNSLLALYVSFCTLRISTFFNRILALLLIKLDIVRPGGGGSSFLFCSFWFRLILFRFGKPTGNNVGCRNRRSIPNQIINVILTLSTTCLSHGMLRIQTNISVWVHKSFFHCVLRNLISISN